MLLLGVISALKTLQQGPGMCHRPILSIWKEVGCYSTGTGTNNNLLVWAYITLKLGMDHLKDHDFMWPYGGGLFGGIFKGWRRHFENRQALFCSSGEISLNALWLFLKVCLKALSNCQSASNRKNLSLIRSSGGIFIWSQSETFQDIFILCVLLQPSCCLAQKFFPAKSSIRSRVTIQFLSLRQK